MKLLAVTALLLAATPPALAAPKPSITAEQPVSTTAVIDGKAAKTVFDASNATLLACYAKPGPTRMTSTSGYATFAIAADGTASAASVYGPANPAAACMEAAIDKLVFAKPKGGVVAQVTVLLAFFNGTDPIPDKTQLVDPDVYRVRDTGAPSVSLGQPTTKGGALDKAIIRRYLKRNIVNIQYCYEKALTADKTFKLHGTVTASFTILATGLVGDSTAAGMSKDVATCVAGVIKQIEFSKPKGGDVLVRYPLDFTLGTPRTIR